MSGQAAKSSAALHRHGRACLCNVEQNRSTGAQRMADVFAHRGIIEGFYGPPYRHADRLWLVDKLGAWGMNRYVYAPKEDPLHRAEWRTPYEAAAMREFGELVARGAAAGVAVGFAVSPGLTIEYGSATDVRQLQAKFLGFTHSGHASSVWR
jgi:hyaluronoglucosaminidase